MAKSMFTIEQLKAMLDLDEDYSETQRLSDLSVRASSFIEVSTGKDFSSAKRIQPIAKDCAELWIRMRWYEGTEYKKDYDFTLGIENDLMLLKWMEVEAS